MIYFSLLILISVLLIRFLRNQARELTGWRRTVSAGLCVLFMASSVFFLSGITTPDEGVPDGVEADVAYPVVSAAKDGSTVTVLFADYDGGYNVYITDLRHVVYEKSDNLIASVRFCQDKGVNWISSPFYYSMYRAHIAYGDSHVLTDEEVEALESAALEEYESASAAPETEEEK